MRTPQEALELIKEFEGLSLKAYYCPAGKLTIGYGSTRDVTPNMVISEEEADLRLVRDVATHEVLMMIAIGDKVPLTDNQVGALTSLVYNVGIGNFKKSTLLKHIKVCNFQDAAEEFPKWSMSRGKELAGLKRRRLAERELFMRPDGKERGWLKKTG